jgi:hypothetical protein
MTPEEVMDKLEERVGPEGRKLFEQFLRKVNKLRAQQQLEAQAQIGRPGLKLLPAEGAVEPTAMVVCRCAVQFPPVRTTNGRGSSNGSVLGRVLETCSVTRAPLAIC